MIAMLEKTCQFISAWATLSRGASYLAELKEHGTQRDKVDGGEDPTGHCAGLSVLLWQGGAMSWLQAKEVTKVQLYLLLG